MAYVGFKKLEGELEGKPGVRDAGAVAASIGRKKFGKKAFQAHAAKGASMRGLHSLIGKGKK